ncbi:GNAT family N-acetyltransferase [Flavipsychrobacter stenotrophus]|nr:GNAT family N-acetyltransferase [Flavipsychrobacter stenotrophus]
MDFLSLLHTDLDELRELQPVDWADIIAPTLRNINSSFCMVYKAVIDGKMVGTGAVIYHGHTAWLATIIVHPDHRNKGYGKRITQYLIDSIDRVRYPTILLDATHFGYLVYKSLGFETITHHVHFDITSPYPVVASSPHMRPFEQNDLKQILALDRVATGEDRTATLLTKVSTAIVFADGGRVGGFYMPDLMKGLLIADNPVAGIELMKIRLQHQPNCMLPEENNAALDFFIDAGYTQSRTSTRMRLGPAVEWQPEFIYNVASGAIG